MRDGLGWLAGRGGSVTELANALGYERNWNGAVATGQGPRGARIRLDARSLRATLSAPPTVPFELLPQLTPDFATTATSEGTRWRIEATPKKPLSNATAFARAVRAWCSALDSVLALDPSLPLSKRDWV